MVRRELEALADRFENRVVDAADEKYLYQAAYDLKRSRVRAREVVRRERGEDGEGEKPS